MAVIRKIKLKATLNGKIVYDKTLDIPPKSNWIWLAAAAAIWVWKGDGHVKFQTGDDGTNFEAEITFGQKSSADGTEGNRVTLFTGEEITADSFSVTSLFPYEKGTLEAHTPKISNILITGINLDSIMFKDESYEK